MGSLTDDTRRPDTGSTNIEQTVGVWIRQNFAEKQVELWVDGSFQSSWSGTDFKGQIAAVIVEEAYNIGVNHGIAKNAKAMRKALGIQS